MAGERHQSCRFLPHPLVQCLILGVQKNAFYPLASMAPYDGWPTCTSKDCKCDFPLSCAEYSRTFMRIACHYLEGKDIHPVTPGEVSAGSAPLDASASDASSTTGEDSEEVRTVGSDRVRTLQCCSIMSARMHLPLVIDCRLM